MSSSGDLLARDIQALLALIEARARWSHAWVRGRCCVSFALRGVDAQTGVDLLADIPVWSNRAEALSVARKLGGLRNALDARMNRVSPALAQRGDVAALPDRAFGVRLMIVEGPLLVGPGIDGLERIERSAMVVAWDALSARRVAA